MAHNLPEQTGGMNPSGRVWYVSEKVTAAQLQDYLKFPGIYGQHRCLRDCQQKTMERDRGLLNDQYRDLMGACEIPFELVTT
ncbi:hypothetical protein [Endozoicomonas sp. ONNA2]|uniref:hypothetical protein n=1 Tax=Endozoicomonas sp. ONNA2 TaxID=2828741 RepID=UPI002147C634|nr:hypothetical protein [Endozoicomonas sp. ONNA2]